MWGEPIGELWDLEKLAEVCQEQKVSVDVKPISIRGLANIGLRAEMVLLLDVSSLERQRRCIVTPKRPCYILNVKK